MRRFPMFIGAVLLLAPGAAGAEPRMYTATYVANPQAGSASIMVDDVGIANSFTMDTQGDDKISFSANDARGPVGLHYRFDTKPASLVCNGVANLAITGKTLTVWFQSPTEMPPPGCPMPAGATTGTFSAVWD